MTNGSDRGFEFVCNKLKALEKTSDTNYLMNDCSRADTEMAHSVECWPLGSRDPVSTPSRGKSFFLTTLCKL
jgi:hypothetical protein